MELALLLYAASIAENFRSTLSSFTTTFFVLILVSCVGLLFAYLALSEEHYGSDDFETAARAARLARRSIIICVYAWTAFLLVSHLVPSRRDVYVMAGGYVAMKAVKSETVQTAADSALGSIEKWLDKELTKPGGLLDEVTNEKGKKERK